MRRFYRFMGGLTFVFLIAAGALEAHGSDRAKAVLAAAGLAWLATTGVVGAGHAAVTMWRRAGGSALLVRPGSSQDLIERLCDETGWVLAGREADLYRVRSGDHRAPVYIDIRYSEQYCNAVFQSWFPVKFSLEQPPAGLFGRVLLRSIYLRWASWEMSAGRSCEACLVLSACLPVAGMHADLFRPVCEEIATEIRRLRRELHDKFAYDLGEDPTPMTAAGEPRGGLPGRQADTLPAVAQDSEWRQIEWKSRGRAGSA
jgi:hypothetical protein